jgi:hypothetical protein
VEKSYDDDDDDDEVEKHIMMMIMIMMKWKKHIHIMLMHSSQKFFKTSVLTRRQMLSSKWKYSWQAK